MIDLAGRADAPTGSEDISFADVTNNLNAVLAEETALLESFDLCEAGQLLDRKRDAVVALQYLLAKGLDMEGLDADARDQAQLSLRRLCNLANANRIAIERGLAVQMQLIQTIAEAVPKARAHDAPVYKLDGSQSPPRPPEAYAFLFRM